MKRAILIYLLFSVPCTAQWRNAGFHGPDANVLAMATHDTDFFIGDSVSLPGGQYAIYRFVNFASNREVNWTNADSGIDYSHGNISSFASVKDHLFGGMFTANGRAGAGWMSTDNGAHWVANGGGYMVSNGTYVFGEGSAGIYLSTDEGTSWNLVTKFVGNSLAAHGAEIYATTNSGIWRSSDSGWHWSQITTPLIGPVVPMGSLLFIVSNGLIAKSSDSGGNWAMLTVDSAGTMAYVNVLITDGTNLFAGTNKGILVSTDIGAIWTPENTGIFDFENLFPAPYKNLPYTITRFGIFDTLLFADISFWRTDNPLAPPYEYFLAYRPISEMTGKASVSQAPLASDTIEIYPNPTLDHASILAIGTYIMDVHVLNVLGENVLNVPAPQGADITLDLSKLPSGTYFLQIETQNGVVLRKVIRE